MDHNLGKLSWKSFAPLSSILSQCAPPADDQMVAVRYYHTATSLRDARDTMKFNDRN